jgi:hypothetical protein
MKIDPAFEAIYGDRSHVDERFDFGLGPPAVMPPQKVCAVRATLDGFSRADIERRYDGKEMMRAGIHYADEDDIMDGYILPLFERLRAFYRAAAANNQLVMVVFS